MRIAITGASGNVGTALLLALGGNGEHEFVGISRRQPPAAPPYEWAQWHRIDIGAEGARQQLADAFRGVDAVVHLAWLIQPSREREVMRRTNQNGTAAVVDAVRDAGVGHLVHQSSIGTYAPGPGRTVDESWPTTGVPSCSYSVDKAEAERIVDRLEGGDTVVTRTRPGLIFQEPAASEIARYFLGPLVPSRLLGPAVMRFVPLSDRLAFQAVHADDVAAAITLLLERRAGGAFNIAADPVIDRAAFRDLFGGVGPPAPPELLRTLAALTWHARLQPTEPGWVDLAAQVPIMDSGRITALGWRPSRTATETFAAFVRALGRGAGRPGPLLRRRRHPRPGPAGKR